MNTLPILGAIALLGLGIFFVIFGEHDDSPGAQLLGILIASGGVWSVYKLVRRT